jgi:signal transduction histidine kinase
MLLSPMVKHFVLSTLKAKALLWCACAMAVGMVSVLIWTNSNSAWEKYLTQSYQTGYELYASLTTNGSAPDGVIIETLSQLPTPQTTTYTTFVSILPHQTSPIQSALLQLVIHSTDLKYPIAKLAQNPNDTPPQQLGNVIRFLASYCSNPVLLTQGADQLWLRVEGSQIWSCEAAPADYRLLAAAILLIGVAILIVQIDDTASMFTRFSTALRKQGRLGGRHEFDKQGPLELREVIQTVNNYLKYERDKLAERAMIMSGVSHDLGTPATRLRLRTALIEDDDLRKRLAGDIDQMTSMIEGVLTYARSEIDSEETHKISLTSLVESIVADYADVGQPVTFEQITEAEIDASGSVFNARAHTTLTPSEDARRVLAHVRPMSMRRAITNLIDNALKYGRRATVSITTTSTTATIFVADEGNALTASQLDALTGPFLRGDNSNYIEGSGLGLTIVSTIAKQHQGALSFEKTSFGVRAKLSIERLNY